ncbi:MAG: RNA methyltransferase [Bryobacteraceae bacterium]
MAAPKRLTSAQNPLVLRVRKAVQRGSLTDDGLAIAESVHLLEEALRSGCAVPFVLASDAALSTVSRMVAGLHDTSVFGLSPELFRQVASTESSQGVVALVKPPAWTLDQALHGRHPLTVVLDGVQDPGNAGTIVRAAEAFGASGVLFLKGSVNPYNPKCLRAAAGSAFRLPMISGLEPELALAALAQKKATLYAAMPRTGILLPDAEFNIAAAILVGAEGRGVRDELARKALDLRIPTSGVESLNVAVATAVILYEASRQRTTKNLSTEPRP